MDRVLYLNQRYQKEKGSANSTWMSRNMITSGLVILAFLVLHFIDFWVPEMNHKYIEFSEKKLQIFFSVFGPRLRENRQNLAFFSYLRYFLALADC